MRLTDIQVKEYRQHALNNSTYDGTTGKVYTDIRLDKVYDLCDTIEALQRENEQLKEMQDVYRQDLCNAEMNLTHMTELYDKQREVLERAREVLTQIRLDDWPGINAIQLTLDEISEVLK